MVKILEIVKDENIIFSEAEKKYGDYYLHAKATLEYLDLFLTNKVENEAYVFLMFFAQVNKSLKLALLSFLRAHNNQAGMNVRHAFEAFVLAIYGLKNPDLSLYYKEKGTLDELEKVNSLARKWLDQEHPEVSANIKIIKKQLSNVLVHANLRQVFDNFSLHKDNIGEGFATSFFDEENTELTKERINWLANNTLTLMQIVQDIKGNCTYINLADSFNKDIQQLSILGKQLRDQLQVEN
ncbi:hypothetical protein [Paenibacillus sp. CGMCC 1.18879]|uniref:hypothetical protein n=1 Tax=Paenibacillus sp. CGMCC 1.18879 TaxID=2834466 RepID=UPI001CAA0353|nr:hypothetical protein [Paenibacillus sp. CGMCC 1.18879]MBY9079531.1 hypothetical protein [Paenibacillus sp. CGMCC 1.18879]